MPRRESKPERLNRTQLLALVRRLEREQSRHLHMLHDLKVHQEELAAQRDQLADVQRQLEASRDHFEELFDFCPLPYLVLDPNGVLRRINLAGSSLLRIERIWLESVPLLVHVTHDDRRAFLDHMRRCRQATAAVVTTELDLIDAHGDAIPVELASRASSPRLGEALVYHTIATDLRARRQAQREQLLIAAEHERLLNEQRLQRSASDAKDRFLAILSHELRTPLTPVMLTTSAWKDDPKLPDPLRQTMAMIRRNIEAQARLVDDLLDMTRLTQGKLTLRPEVVDVHDVLEEICEQARGEASQAGLELTIRLQAPGHLVSADPLRLRQIVWNLVRNAIRFTPEGGRIAVRTAAADASRIRIDVDDTGVGFDAGIEREMFEPFRQGPRSAVQGGLGLGLAIAKGLVEAHGGTIAARSDGPKRGATFSVVLATTTAVLPSAGLAGAPALPPHGRLRILLVEDHADTARALALVLEHEGYTVALAHSVQEAIAASEHHELDLVVSDLGLPDGSGLDLMRQLKARKPMRGIALTGYGRREDLDETTRAGFERHLTKPVDVSTLIATIESLRSAAA